MINQSSRLSAAHDVLERVVGMLAPLALLAPAAHAHHSFATRYGYDDQVEVSGVVSEFRLANPHSFMQVEVMLETDETVAAY